MTLSALYSTLNTGLEMVDLASALRSSSPSSSHRPSYLHPYDDVPLVDLLKSSLLTSNARALALSSSGLARRRLVQDRANAEAATGISTYLYTQPSGEEVYAIRFDVEPGREEGTRTYYAFLDLVE
ncbi:hypothetical protein TrRE_jg5324, partial [Triparma retinervis]